MGKEEFVSYVLKLSKEPSTWRGIILFVTGLTGLQISTQLFDSLTSLGIAASGVIGMVMLDNGDQVK